MLRVVRLLALRRLRLQPLRSALAALVVGAGASLVVTIVVIMSSLTTSVQEAGRQLAGPAPLRVIGPVPKGGISPEVFRKVEATKGVGTAVPLIQGIALIDRPGQDRDKDTPVLALGFDCRIQAVFGDFGCDPHALAAVQTAFVGKALADRMGTDADIRTNLGRIPLKSTVPIPQLDGINGGNVVAFSIPEAQRQLGRPEGVDLVYVLPRPGVAVPALQHDLERALGPSVAVLDALDPPPLIGIVVANFVPLFSIVALLTLAIGGVLIRNSINLSLEERRRQTAIVGALGGSQRLLVWGTLLESAVLGLAGGLVGVVLGVAIAHPVSGGLNAFTERILGFKVHIEPNGAAFAVALGSGLLVSLVTSIGPARRAVRLDVAAELANRGAREDVRRSTSPWRLLVAALAAAGGIALCAQARADGGIARYQSTLAPVAFLVTMVPCVYLVSTIVPMLLAGFERWLPFRRAAPRLAVSNLRREPRRTGVMALAIGFAMGVGFITASLNTAIRQEITEQFTKNVKGIEVSAVEPNNSVNIDARLSPAVLKHLEKLPEVGGILRQSYVVTGNRSGDLVGVSAYTDPWTDLSLAVGRMSVAGLDAGRVVIGPALARSEGLRPGDRVTLQTPRGPVRLPVMAVQYSGDFGGRNVLMGLDLLQELYGTEAPVSVNVTAAPGVSDAQLRRAVEAAHLDPSIELRDRDEVIDRVANDIKKQLSTFDAIQRGLLVMSFIAVLSTLLLVGIQRQRELGMLAAVGMTPSEIRRMVLAEAGIVAVLGVFVTCFLAPVQYLALVLITPVIIGYKDPYVADLAAMLAYGGIAVAVAVLAALYPSHRAGKVEVLEALRYE